ncbi:response regulator [Baekduia soli]|uniref:Response regulator n=1 Tax=Baekduia soli TaxID=496014 RepID=A0A5B8U5I9_9ACTN|nr:response regulator [Baekduia soli]
MPRTHGLDAVRRLRATGHVGPVMVLSCSLDAVRAVASPPVPTRSSPGRTCPRGTAHSCALRYLTVKSVYMPAW